MNSLTPAQLREFYRKAARASKVVTPGTRKGKI